MIKIKYLPFLIFFITEVKESGDVEEKFHEVMQDKKNKSKVGQTMKTKKENKYRHQLAERHRPLVQSACLVFLLFVIQSWNIAQSG